jgi:hypothetical protein
MRSRPCVSSRIPLHCDASGAGKDWHVPQPHTGKHRWISQVQMSFKTGAHMSQAWVFWVGGWTCLAVKCGSPSRETFCTDVPSSSLLCLQPSEIGSAKLSSVTSRFRSFLVTSRNPQSSWEVNGHVLKGYMALGTIHKLSCSHGTLSLMTQGICCLYTLWTEWRPEQIPHYCPCPLDQSTGNRYDPFIVPICSCQALQNPGLFFFKGTIKLLFILFFANINLFYWFVFLGG